MLITSTRYYIRFILKDKIITWYFSPYLIMVFTFLLGFGLTIIVKKLKQFVEKKLKNHQKQTKDPLKIEGGGFEKCIEPDKIYEVIDPGMKLAIRDMFNHINDSDTLFITPHALILAKYVAYQFKMRLMIEPHITKVVIKYIQGAMIEAGIVGIPTTTRELLLTLSPMGIVPLLAIFTSLPAVALVKTGSFILASLVGSIGIADRFSGKFCDRLLQAQPLDVIEGHVLNYANQQKIAPGTIFVKGNPDLLLYEKLQVNTKVDKIRLIEQESDSSCQMLAEFTFQNCEPSKTLTVKDIEILELDKTFESRSYEQKYIEIKGSTPSFDEIKTHNQGKNLEKTRRSREAYDKKLQNYQQKKERLRIKENEKQLRIEDNKGQESTPKFKLRGSKIRYDQGKTVNFLEKFGDPKSIPDTEQWDIKTSSSQDENAIRIQDSEL